MRILFIARHFTYFRNYDAALRELARRGHTIHLAVEKQEAQGGQQAVETLAREWPGITYGEVPDRRDDQWADLARRLRLGLDYLRYLDDFYDDAPLRRVRARERTPLALIRLADPPLVGSRPWRALVGRLVHDVDLAIPPPDVIADYIREQRPDILLITPLVDLGSQQIDYVRAARQLAIPTGLAVWSWDHLSSKAYIRECPERVFVWNATQQREALEVHRVPADRVVVTGAQCFDHWFDRRPSRTREEFCAQLGLPVDRPIVLWVCTGLIMGSPPEPPFVREWLQQLRQSADPRVATAGVLVRPHPGQAHNWDGVDLSDLGPVAIWGGNPIDNQSRADYFDSLYHATAVAGINTSAFIEAGIVGREVLALLPPAFHDNHEGTVHFRYLMEIGGGLLRISRDFDAHVTQLSEALARPPSTEHPHRAFLESFVRPAGLDQAATPRFVQAVEALGACPVDVADVRPAPRWAARALARVMDLAARPEYERWKLSPREFESSERLRIKKEDRAQERAAERRAREEDKVRRRAEAEARRAAEDAAKEQAKAARERAKAEALAQKRAEVEAAKQAKRAEADAAKLAKRAAKDAAKHDAGNQPVSR
jgi:hypothetical protein